MKVIRKVYNSARGALFSTLPTWVMQSLLDEIARTKFRIEEILRQRQAMNEPEILPEIRSVNGEVLKKSILALSAP
jgi:hypothetical protein